MKKQLNELNGTFHVKHQAICRNDRFEGDLRDSIDEAFEDAAAHRRQPGHEHHIIDIVTKQTSVRQFIDVD